jgi:hypothetical protein
MRKIALAVAAVALGAGVCGTDVCSAQTVRPVEVQSCWAALDIARQEIRQSALPYRRVDPARLSVDMKVIYGRGFQLITWKHDPRRSECDKATTSWFDDPA